MRYHTGEWEMHLSTQGLDALEGYLTEQGMHKYRVFYGRAMAGACGGLGEVSYNLLWNTENDEVIYLILYVWTD